MPWFSRDNEVCFKLITYAMGIGDADLEFQT
jgi:hypothetical protein